MSIEARLEKVESLIKSINSRLCSLSGSTGGGIVQTASVPLQITGSNISVARKYGDGSNLYIGVSETFLEGNPISFIPVYLAGSTITYGYVQPGGTSDYYLSIEVTSGSISTLYLADDAVTQDKIADDAVGTDQLIDDSVTADKLAPGAGMDKRWVEAIV